MRVGLFVCIHACECVCAFVGLYFKGEGGLGVCVGVCELVCVSQTFAPVRTKIGLYACAGNRSIAQTSYPNMAASSHSRFVKHGYYARSRRPSASWRCAGA